MVEQTYYRKLKLSILLQTVFVTALTLLVGGVILKYFLEDRHMEKHKKAVGTLPTA